jgi:hypothetical protein
MFRPVMAPNFHSRVCRAIAVLATALLPLGTEGDENVYLLEVPDYGWHAGCFGTAAGNLMGFWDRRGFPEMYTGPTGGGIAPLSSAGQNVSIRSLWASQAGLDGRPSDKPGHIDDYWQSTQSFESTAPDPYAVAGRSEHLPDCLGDFMGQSQRKYNDLDGECSGNIDGFAFNFWDKAGNRRTNFTPPAGIRDIQSGLREWSRYRGYDAVVSSQLVDVSPEAPEGTGFSFEDIKVEINAGYPVLLLLQKHGDFSRNLPGLDRANPNVHAVLVHGYVESVDSGVQAVRFKTSWGQGDYFAQWEDSVNFIFGLGLPMRGAITYRPQPKITSLEQIGNQIRLRWEGPNAVLQSELTGIGTPAHHYVVEKASVLSPDAFAPATEPAAGLEAFVQPPTGAETYYRVRLVGN